MLEGIIIKPLIKRFDERGFFSEIIRLDWSNVLQGEAFVQANLSISYPNIIRAWHRHLRGQVDCFVIIKGALKICIFDDDTEELNEIISTGEVPQLVRVPGRYWHGFKVVGDEAAWLIYFVNRLYDHNDPDEERRPWNDPTIVPRKINGKTTDPRVDKPWDWNYPPHR